MFKNPFSFEGRIRRLEFGLSIIIQIILIVIVEVISIPLGKAGPFIMLALLIPLYWFIWAQGAKRCHDLGKSGWWQLIPFYGLFMLFQNGEVGENIFGSDPKNPGLSGALDSETLDGHMRVNS